jgi:hypothetical protein
VSSRGLLRRPRCSSIRAIALPSIPSVILPIMPGSCRPTPTPGDRKPGPITQASCWAHGRRKFFELADVAAKVRGGLSVLAPLAVEAVKRTDAIFDIEREINGRSIEERLAVRRERVAPLVADLEAWMQAQRGRFSRHSDIGKAMDYMPARAHRIVDTQAMESTACECYERVRQHYERLLVS